MTRTYWATRGKHQSGPHPTREAALAAFRAAYPARPCKATDICTGYGNGGPYFDIQWSAAQ